MNRQGNRWAVVAAMFFAVLVAVGIGSMAYQAGVAHGLALKLPEGAAFPMGPYGWYRPWGFGWSGPLFFLLIWFLVIRGIFWRGRWRSHHWHELPPRFEEWHRRAHERMSGAPPSPTNL